MIFLSIFEQIFDKLKKIFFAQFSRQNRVYNYRMTWTEIEELFLRTKIIKMQHLDTLQNKTF
jgi:hypothetical protein